MQFIDARRFSCRGAEADSHDLAVQQIMVIPRLQFLYEVIDVPGMQVVKVLVVARCVQRRVPSTAAVCQQGRHLPFRGAEAFPMIFAVQADHRDSPIAVHTVVDVPVALVVLTPCPGADAYSMDHTARLTIKIPQFCLRQDDRRPGMQIHQVSQVQSVRRQ